MKWGIRSRVRYFIPLFSPPEGFFRFKGFYIDEGLAIRTGAPREHYALFARMHDDLQKKYAPVKSDHIVLEAGCGSGMDAILLTKRLSSRGRYYGFDIDKISTDWCTANITQRFPNFRFFHFDVRNSTYNPEGILSQTEVEFPATNCSVDRFIAQSVFTHLLPEVFSHYLQELRRVLKPKGLALITAFVGDTAEIEASVENANTPFCFPHQYAKGVFVSDPERPSDGVVYEKSIFWEKLANSGLKLNTYLPGYWATGRAKQPYGQDVLVLSSAA